MKKNVDMSTRNLFFFLFFLLIFCCCCCNLLFIFFQYFYFYSRLQSISGQKLTFIYKMIRLTFRSGLLNSSKKNPSCHARSSACQSEHALHTNQWNERYNKLRKRRMSFNKLNKKKKQKKKLLELFRITPWDTYLFIYLFWSERTSSLEHCYDLRIIWIFPLKRKLSALLCVINKTPKLQTGMTKNKRSNVTDAAQSMELTDRVQILTETALPSRLGM